MEKDFIHSDSLANLEFLTDREAGVHYHENFELLYLMNGRLTVTVGEDSCAMEPGDMILVNASRKHSYQSGGHVLIGRFSISYGKVRELLGQNTVLFWCNSSMDRNGAYEELRRIIAGIFNQFVNGGRNQILLNSLYYQMLHVLTSHFLLNPDDLRYEDEKSREDGRLQEIFSYIRANYRQNIKLQEVADCLYLSPTYLSKYIKKKCGISFVELVNRVRMGHAMEDLMYSDASVMKVAMDNGFASVAAYNKAFKDTYHVTPSEFRRNLKLRQKEKGGSEEEKKRQVCRQVEDYLARNPFEEPEQKAVEKLELTVNGAAPALFAWNKGCCRMINAGRALDLTKSVFQEQILAMKDRMGFLYVRFWDIYAPELFIDIHAPREKLHFGQLDLVTDFLVKHGLKPYIELGFKPFKLLKNTDKAVKEVHREQEFQSDEEMQVFYQALIHHFVKRYSEEEVQSWYFEYWEKEDTFFQVMDYVHTPVSLGTQEEYFRRFDVIAGAIRSELSEARIGGGGFILRYYEKGEFAEHLRRWKGHFQKPDFITISCYPYELEKEGNAYYEKKSTDGEFMLHNLELAREGMAEAGFSECPLFVSEYSLSLSNRNAVNDSCVKGAFLVKNSISCMRETELSGHWLFSDTYADFSDTQKPLFGGCGLLTKNGIPKPSFYAFEFLNRLYGNVLACHTNCLVTGNDRGSFRLVCHNYKTLNYNYYMAQEDEIQIRDIPYMADDRGYLTIRLALEHIKKGCYLIKQQRIASGFGSVQDEWQELNLETELSIQEQEYLRRRATPRLSISQAETEGGRLELTIELQPNEIQYVQISRR